MNPCTHDSAEPFPDPVAAEAAGLMGGADAVRAIEVKLFRERLHGELSIQLQKALKK